MQRLHWFLVLAIALQLCLGSVWASPMAAHNEAAPQRTDAARVAEAHCHEEGAVEPSAVADSASATTNYLRMPTTPSVRAVRQFWAALQARDWPAARTCLQDDMETVWWTSGERFSGADALIKVNQHYPEGWTIQLLEVEHLQDGRVMSLARVDHPPQRYFATSFFRVDDGRIAGIDEYWATVDAPPDWRTPQVFAGLSHFDPSEDARAQIP